MVGIAGCLCSCCHCLASAGGFGRRGDGNACGDEFQILAILADNGQERYIQHAHLALHAHKGAHPDVLTHQRIILLGHQTFGWCKGRILRIFQSHRIVIVPIVGFQGNHFGICGQDRVDAQCVPVQTGKVGTDVSSLPHCGRSHHPTRSCQHEQEHQAHSV